MSKVCVGYLELLRVVSLYRSADYFVTINCFSPRYTVFYYFSRTLYAELCTRACWKLEYKGRSMVSYNSLITLEHVR